MSSAPPEPLHLVTGPEDLLADRAVSKVVAAARAADPAVQVIDVMADGYERGDLTVHTSPSLFGEAKVVVVRGLDEASDELIADTRALVASPEPEVVLVLRHRTGTRGKGLLDAAKAAGAVAWVCSQVKTDAEKSDFVVREFRSAGRQVTSGAVRALVEAVGQDLAADGGHAAARRAGAGGGCDRCGGRGAVLRRAGGGHRVQGRRRRDRRSDR